MSRMLDFILSKDQEVRCSVCEEVMMQNKYRSVQKCGSCLDEEYQKRDRRARAYLRKMNSILESRDLPTVKIPDLPEHSRYFELND